MKILVVFGTRPEAVKLAPVIVELKKEKRIHTTVCSTGQHKDMVEHVSKLFNIKIDYDLEIMKRNQNLFDITSGSIKKLQAIFNKEKPDLLLVQGDTTTAFTASLAAFYNKIKVGHVEAGLRSFRKFEPFPEEINRKIISILTDFHFVPTRQAKQNLLQEGISRNSIYLTGNTVVDAVTHSKKIMISSKEKLEKKLINYLPANLTKSKNVLVTLHRREKFGPVFEMMLLTLKELADEHNYNFIFPVHLNPNVKNPVEKILKNSKNFFLLPPLDYLSFLYLMHKSYFIMTDSGGVQEECFSFKKPVIVMRDVTERNEAVSAGYSFLTGNSRDKIIKTFGYVDKKLKAGHNFFQTKNPFGDGRSSTRIVKIIKENFHFN